MRAPDKELVFNMLLVQPLRCFKQLIGFSGSFEPILSRTHVRLRKVIRHLSFPEIRVLHDGERGCYADAAQYAAQMTAWSPLQSMRTLSDVRSTAPQGQGEGDWGSKCQCGYPRVCPPRLVTVVVISKYCTLRQRCSRYVRRTLSFSKTDRYHHLAPKYFLWPYNLDCTINTF